MNIALYLNYEDIDKEARRFVEYVGAKRDDADYERILLQTEDSGLLDKLHGEMVAGLMSILMSFDAAERDITAEDDTTITKGKKIVYRLPMNANPTTPDSVEKEAVAYCVAYITTQWMKIVGLADAETKAAEAVNHLNNIFNAMTRRTEPHRVIPPHISNIIGWTTNNDAYTTIEVTTEES